MKQLHIEGRRWFDEQWGNTYHSVRIWADGKDVAYVPYQYGYGECYIQTASAELEKLGLIKSREGEPLWKYCEKEGIQYTYSVIDCRKKDL